MEDCDVERGEEGGREEVERRGRKFEGTDECY
jgi:hypothetical protein